jgi:hypothetical protein
LTNTIKISKTPKDWFISPISTPPSALKIAVYIDAARLAADLVLREHMRTADEKQQEYSGRNKTNPIHLDLHLEQRFKKTAEFFSKPIEYVPGFVELVRVFRRDPATVRQIIFIE